MKKVTLELVRRGFGAKDKARANVLEDDSYGIQEAIDRAVKKLGGDGYVWNSEVKGMMTVLHDTCVIGEYSATIDEESLSRSYLEWIRMKENKLDMIKLKVLKKALGYEVFPPDIDEYEDRNCIAVCKGVDEREYVRYHAGDVDVCADAETGRILTADEQIKVFPDEVLVRTAARQIIEKYKDVEQSEENPEMSM